MANFRDQAAKMISFGNVKRAGIGFAIAKFSTLSVYAITQDKAASQLLSVKLTLA